MYDYLIVGSGLFGSVFAHEMHKKGKSCLVLERRPHVGGNIYCENKDGINIHTYGAHIFHTSNKKVWDYVNQFVEFNNYVNSPVANYKGELYNLPFNMNTFTKMWGVVTPKEAAEKIAQQRAEAGITDPKNLEEQAISLIGTDIYTKLIKGYTEKQWGRSCTELPAFIIKRLPVRYTFDNNYFNDRYQGIPVGGYNKLIEGLLAGIEIRTGVDYLKHRDEYKDITKKIVYTGPIDEYFGYKLGPLEYRGLRFETERLEEENHQGVAVMNYTDHETPWTRIIEHKHFEFGTQPVTYVTKEYPADWQPGEEAYYPVNNARNQSLYEQYAALAQNEQNVIFGGRLAEYKYYDMDDVVESALKVVSCEKE
ncbi:UDP-galactopyranose mutase [Acidaminococcus intestini]|uniref:UDP-galactopyranose mutase n=1 Tax=Acidaminococcus intestini TaxID=187327 RepID=UPI0036F3F828